MLGPQIISFFIFMPMPNVNEFGDISLIKLGPEKMGAFSCYFEGAEVFLVLHGFLADIRHFLSSFRPKLEISESVAWSSIENKALLYY